MNLILLLFCLALSFIFSGTEAGLLSLSRIRLRVLARHDDPSAIRLEKLFSKSSQLFVTVLFVTSFSNIVAVLLLANFFVGAFGRWGYLCTVLVAFPIFLILTEALPKSIFRRFPYQAIASISVILQGVTYILKPVMAVGSWLLRDIFRLKRPVTIFLAREDIKSVTRYIERMGMLGSVERQMIHNAVDFRTVKVSDVMVKRSQVKSVNLDAPVQDVVKISQETRFDYLPLVDDHGAIAGLVNVFDIILDQRPSLTAKAYLRRMLVVKDEDPAVIALRRLRASPQPLALVTNAQAETVGIVGIEDLLTPLVKTV
jgi:putative hemolysin